MNTLTLKNTLNLTTLVLSIALITSCGVKKSSDSSNISVAASTSVKTLASCNKAASTNMSMNISAVSKSSTGEIDPNWVKIKFNQLSATVFQSGNTVRFFKWKVYQNQSSLDVNPLIATQYDLATKEFNSSGTSSIDIKSITTTNGYYLELNDANGSYQALKVVVYSSTGSIVSQMNILIPQFAASPSEYSISTDGTIRVQLLQDLHPLKNTDTSTWSTQNYTDYFQAFCF